MQRQPRRGGPRQPPQVRCSWLTSELPLWLTPPLKATQVLSHDRRGVSRVFGEISQSRTGCPPWSLSGTMMR